jgi:predicted 3-demethylubiquinone-9 3-methyltransferase (glyoxalase superfamily)
MPVTQRIAPCLWFDRQAEDAAKFYVSVFKNSKILTVSRYSSAGQEQHRMTPGTVMLVEFELDGQPFTALNGGPAFTFTEAISLQISCETQQEVDYYWDKLTQGGDPTAQQCGWLKDKYGLSWQVVPTVIPQMLKDAESPKTKRVMEVIMRMKKPVIAELEHAFAG